MLVSEQVILMSVIVGFIPYVIKWQRTRGGNVLEVRALFWSVQCTDRQWTIRIPLIERLRHAIWMVILQLREGDHSQE